MDSFYEKLGQRLAVGFEGLTVPEEYRQLVREYKTGNVILFRRNIESLAQLQALCSELKTLITAETGHEPFIMIDEEGGIVSRMAEIGYSTPGAMLTAQSGREENAEETARLIGQGLRRAGINFDLAPVLDCNTNPLNPVIGVRSFGSDTDVVSRFGAAYIHGLHEEGIIACGKHFPGHGDTSRDSHIDLPVVDKPLEEIRAVELVPFRSCIGEGIDAIMSAHVVFPALEPDRIPSTVSRKVMTGLLREELGFDGLILTDGMEMQAVMDLYGIENATWRALEAGCDIGLICHVPAQAAAAMRYIRAKADTGEFDLEQNEKSVSRILKKKQTLAKKTPALMDDAAWHAAAFRLEQQGIMIDPAVPAVTKDTIMTGLPLWRSSKATDQITLDAASECASALGVRYIAPRYLRKPAKGKRYIFILTHNHPKLPDMLEHIRAYAAAGADVTAVAMNTPYCLETLPPEVHRIRVGEYTQLAVKALAERLRNV